MAEECQICGFGTDFLGVQVKLLIAVFIQFDDVPPVIDRRTFRKCISIVIPESKGGIERHTVCQQAGIDVSADIIRIISFQIFAVVVESNIAAGIGILDHVSSDVAVVNFGHDLGDAFTGIQVINFNRKFRIFFHELISDLLHLAGG